MTALLRSSQPLLRVPTLRWLHCTVARGAAPSGGLMEPDARTDPANEILDHCGGPSNAAHFRRIARDFRSDMKAFPLTPADTITMPTDAQVLFAHTATRGDDVEHEDATTSALESRLAAMAGKEAALFCASSTMSNQLAIRSILTSPPHSVVSDVRSHTFVNEAGGAAVFSQATTYPARPSNGLYLTAEDVEGVLILGSDIHTAPTKLITLENTINGIIHPQEEVVRIGELADRHGIPMHLDGARVWNTAAVEIERRGLDACSEGDKTKVLSQLLEPFATASLCLSKGLGAPIGS